MSYAQAQQGEESAEDKSKLKKQIQLTDQLLRETEDKTQKSLNELTIINKQLKLRQKLLSTLNREIKQYQQEITDLDGVVCAMEEDIDRLIADYAVTAQLTYKAFYSENFWLALFSARSLSEAYHRGVYFRQFSRFRKQQINLIRKTQKLLEEKQLRLAQSIKESKELILVKRDEMELLRETQNLQKEVFTSLQSKEKGYRKELEAQRKEMKETLGKTEMEQGEVAIIDDPDRGTSFFRNKGFHSWPVSSSRSLIVSRYGTTQDPYGNEITNDGIYIRTSMGEKVRSIFRGQITAVKQVPLSGMMVVIEHGDYRTVYANLEECLVKRGDLVETNQTIGKVRTDQRTGETVLNFLVYKSPATFENPEEWIVNIAGSE